jgi:hypothetical protein
MRHLGYQSCLRSLFGINHRRLPTTGVDPFPRQSVNQGIKFFTKEFGRMEKATSIFTSGISVWLIILVGMSLIS